MADLAADNPAPVVYATADAHVRQVRRGWKMGRKGPLSPSKT